MRAVRLAVLLVTLFILGSMFSIPKTNAVCNGTWNGAAGDGKWETAGNWSGGCVPAATATIPNGAFVVTISTTQSLSDLVVGIGDTVVCTSTCDLTVTGDLFNEGTFNNFGTITTLALDNPGTFTNSRTVTVTSTLTNEGTFTCTNTCTLNLGGLDNHGTFINLGTMTAIGLRNAPDGTFTNYGKIIINGLFENEGPFINECHGTVNKSPGEGTGLFTTLCVVGGEVLSLDYASLALSALPWILILATLATAATILLRQKLKPLL